MLMPAQRFSRERRINCWREERKITVTAWNVRRRMSREKSNKPDRRTVFILSRFTDSHAAQRKLHEKSFYVGNIFSTLSNRLWWQKQLQISMFASQTRIQISFEPRFTFPFALFSFQRTLKRFYEPRDYRSRECVRRRKPLEGERKKNE